VIQNALAQSDNRHCVNETLGIDIVHFDRKTIVRNIFLKTGSFNQNFCISKNCYVSGMVFAIFYKLLKVHLMKGGSKHESYHNTIK
jgi:hypothetical protein